MWIEWGFEITSEEIKQPGKVGRVIYLAGGVAGNKFDQITEPGINSSITYYGVGGTVVSVNKLALLTPYISLASTILVATVATFFYVKRIKKREQNNG